MQRWRDGSVSLTECQPPRSLVCVIVLLLSLPGCVGRDPESADPEIKRLDGSTITVDALTARIEALTAAANVQGLTVTVFNDGQPVYSRAFGHADLSEGRPLRTHTAIYGASLSKAVFGVLVMKLVEQGVVELDTEAFAACLADEASLALVDADMADGAPFVRGTPTFIMLYDEEGSIIPGALPAESFIETLQGILDTVGTN